MVKIFKENRKMTLLGFFGVVFFALAFWLVQPAPKVEAACSVGCKLDSGFCYFDVGTQSTEHKVCIMGSGIAEEDFWTWDTSCTGSFGDCKQDSCNSGWGNGTVCSVLTNKGGSCDTAGNYFEADGKWEASSNSCVQCSGALKRSQIGNTSFLTYADISDVFSTACGADSACQGKVEGCVSGNAGFCNSSGAYTNCPLSNCVAPGVCPAASALTVSANPNIITQNTATNIEFTVTDASGNVSGAAVAISGAGISASCSSNTDNDGKCTASVTATSTGTATATASKATYTDGTTSITVQAAPACPKGSGTGSGTSFAVDFKQSAFTTSETFKISYMIPPEEQDGAICIYAPGASTPSYSKSGTPNEHSTTVPKTNSNFDTGHKPTSAGTWKATINNSSSCSSTSTCFATTNVTAVVACDNNGIIEGTEQCDGTNLGLKDCSTIGMGFTGGTLSCKTDCTFDTSACTTSSGGPTSLSITANPNAITVNSAATITFTVTDGTSAVNGATVSITNAGTTGMGTSGTCTAAVSSNQCFFSVTATSTGTATATASKTGYTSGSTTINVAGVASSAGPCASGTTNYRSPLSYCSIQELIQGATGWALGLVSSIVILFLVYGGIMYTMAAGDETKMESAKNIIYYAILGLAIILVSYTLITEVKTILKVK